MHVFRFDGPVEYSQGLLGAHCETCHNPDESGEGRADFTAATIDELVSDYQEHTTVQDAALVAAWRSAIEYEDLDMLVAAGDAMVEALA